MECYGLLDYVLKRLFQGRWEFIGYKRLKAGQHRWGVISFIIVHLHKQTAHIQGPRGRSWIRRVTGPFVKTLVWLTLSEFNTTQNYYTVTCLATGRLDGALQLETFLIITSRHSKSWVTNDNPKIASLEIRSTGFKNTFPAGKFEVTGYRLKHSKYYYINKS